MTINDRVVEAEPEETILSAALRAGIKIPNKCHNGQLKHFASCRLCMVEVVQGKRKRLVASCAFPARDGLEIKTETPQIVSIRKMLIELLWPTVPDYAKQYGVTKSRFPSGNSECNLCGQCVRYCNEVAKKGVAYFKGRGINRHIAIVPGLEQECVYCQKCMGLCTGGALMNMVHGCEVWKEKPAAAAK
jgi:NADH dehydrogenase/NADH:ubiquinone oxidoreductase subunit G